MQTHRQHGVATGQPAVISARWTVASEQANLHLPGVCNMAHCLSI